MGKAEDDNLADALAAYDAAQLGDAAKAGDTERLAKLADNAKDKDGKYPS